LLNVEVRDGAFLPNDRVILERVTAPADDLAKVVDRGGSLQKAPGVRQGADRESAQ
jgi:hypothetical protein